LQNAVVRGTLLGLQYMGKDKGGKGGVVVNISSIAGLGPFAFCPVYVATKHAVIGLTRSFGVSTTYSNMGNLYYGQRGFFFVIFFHWVMARSLNFIFRRFGIFYLFHLCGDA